MAKPEAAEAEAAKAEAETAAEIEERIKRRIRTLRQLEGSKLEKSVGRLVYTELYHNEISCRLYLEFCDETIFGNPVRGLVAARVAPVLAGFVAPEERLGLRARAFAVLGSSYRAVGRLEEAEAAYQDALALIDHLSESEQPDVWKRLSSLRSYQGKHEEAQMLAERVVRIWRRLDHPDLAIALIRRGVALYYAVHRDRSALLRARPKIVTDLSEALDLSAKSGDTRTQEAAVNNLCAIAIKPKSHAELKDTVDAIHEARIRLRIPRCGRRRYLPWLKLRWMEARCFLQAGLDRHAERLLEETLQGMRAIGAQEAVLVGLDLAELYFVETVAPAGASKGEQERSRACWSQLQKLAEWICAELKRRGDTEKPGETQSESIQAAEDFLKRIKAQELTLTFLEEVTAKVERGFAVEVVRG